MRAGMYAKLVKVMQKFIDDNYESEEWERDNFYSPDNHAELMAKAAAVVYDGIVSSSENTQDVANR